MKLVFKEMQPFEHDVVIITPVARQGVPDVASYHALQDWKECSDWLAADLDERSYWRSLPLMLGPPV